MKRRSKDPRGRVCRCGHERFFHTGKGACEYGRGHVMGLTVLTDEEAHRLHCLLKRVTLAHPIYDVVRMSACVKMPEGLVRVRVFAHVPERDARPSLPPFEERLAYGLRGAEVRSQELRQLAQNVELRQLAQNVEHVDVAGEYEMVVTHVEMKDEHAVLKRVTRFVHDALVRALTHELDEMLLIDGERVSDPHDIKSMRVEGSFIV